MNRKFSVCFLDTLGLLYTGDTVYKKGLGGSESAAIYMGEELIKLGFDVTIYNKCEKEGNYSGVEYIDLSKIRNEERSFDILISLRSVLPLVPQKYGWDIWNKFKKDIGPFASIVENAKKRFVWMHDTFLEGEEWLEPLILDGKIDEVFLLSDWHSHYVSQSNHWDTPKRDYAQLKHKIFQTRNGIKRHINEVDILKKDPNLFIYNSSVTKGMIPLVEKVWPLVKRQIPKAKLIVIGGYYRGAGPNNTADEGEKKFFQLSEANEGKLDIHFTGVITQKEIAEYLTKATWMIYPPDFPETYGISTLEAINYNVIPLTSNFGALEEVALDQCSFKTHYNIFHDDTQIQRFVEMVVSAYNNPYLKQQKQYACNEVKPYSTWDTIAAEWVYHFYKLYDEIIDREFTEKVNEITTNVNRIYNRRNINPENRYESFNADKQRKLIIVSPVYNAENYIGNCIRSVAAQLYDNYEHYIINDVSTDNTTIFTHIAINSLPKKIKDKFHLKINVEKSNAITNQIKIIQEQNEDSIIVLLDGDDWLYNDPNIFRYINEQYHNGAEMTYGSCWSLADNIPLVAQPYPDEVKKNKTFRDYSFSWGIPYTHLRTFTKKLFDKINLESLKDENGKYFGAGGDGPFLYSLLEAAEPNNIFCIQRMLVNYNDINPLNDYKVNGEEQTRVKNIGQRTFEKKNLIDNLSNIHQKVLDRDPAATEEYKFIISNRDDVWVDNLEVTTIKTRTNWLFNKFKELNIPKESKILDIGSWTGGLANEFYDLGYKNITCFDIGKEVVNFGEKTFPQFKWICDDIETYQTNEKYDVIFMLEIIEHLVDPFKTIEKVKTFLNGGGRIFFTIPTEDTIFGETEKEVGREHSGPEHISIITKEKLNQITNNIETIQNGFNKWYVGYIEKEEKFSVIIPTMWKSLDFLKQSLENYIKEDLIDEIIIINNYIDATPDWYFLKNPKIKMLLQSKNIGVNPAWNIGVAVSVNNLICISNDDILFDIKLFSKIQKELSQSKGLFSIVAGLKELNQPEVTDGSIDFIEWKPGFNIWGYGQLMFLHKSNWVPVIDELKIYCGDNFIFQSQLDKGLKNYSIVNLKYQNEYAATAKTFEGIHEFGEKEIKIYENWLENKNKKMKRILIGIPTAKYIESETFLSIYNLEKPKNCEIDFQYFFGYNIAQIRNLMADYSIRNGYDYIFWVDSDIVLPKDSLVKLFNLQQDIATGVYIQRKEDNKIPEIYIPTLYGGITNINIDEILGNKIFEVKGCGFGCVLTTTKCLAEIGYPQFEYFNALDHKNTISEDVDFCRKAQNKEYKIFADTSIKCNHIGQKYFSI